MTIEQDERRGEDYRQWRESGPYKETFGQIEANVITALKSLKVDDPQRDDKQGRLCDMLRAIAKIDAYARDIVTTGTMAAMEQERRRTLRERVTDALR